MTLVVVLLLALAAFRLARLVAIDTLLDPPRAALYRWAWVDQGPEADPVPRAGTWRIYTYELATCPHCLGVWFAVAVWFTWYRRWPGWTDLVVIAAVAGAQSALASFVAGVES